MAAKGLQHGFRCRDTHSMLYVCRYVCNRKSQRQDFPVFDQFQNRRRPRRSSVVGMFLDSKLTSGLKPKMYTQQIRISFKSGSARAADVVILESKTSKRIPSLFWKYVYEVFRWCCPKNMKDNTYQHFGALEISRARLVSEHCNLPRCKCLFRVYVCIDVI